MGSHHLLLSVSSATINAIGMGIRNPLLMKSSNNLLIRTFFSNSLPLKDKKIRVVRNYSHGVSSSLEPPDVSRLAKTARISLTPDEVEELAPKIRQVVDWFGQLQAVDLHSVEPSIRADTESENLRDDVALTFENREGMINGIPSYNEPYIKVPKILNKE
ncbi:glutamyl-tRNA(Gln) amidotransferase subunit C, chloroplastic/mitochondrial [Impatiens glandulifera]|uniref:glutamyl-tRNA(Gln) amidotransferase subunit C, chloroplastic/mitochondrial n=1 Tax=Impatiens glandulifera TaxID=253017 RepID=UPI001FB167A9|nr:glutamyl-tRNA(Gln) amidotransferase subunit C, chloroplastic/mitochondrial [Impatiens glandulifera]XP_047335150.1 glutamyl-tRNA(Gln) amidotransferase subunit C, chloroplastic/mitochondrial [Impatiens glandulifera]